MRYSEWDTHTPVNQPAHILFHLVLVLVIIIIIVDITCCFKAKCHRLPHTRTHKLTQNKVIYFGFSKHTAHSHKFIQHYYFFLCSFRSFDDCVVVVVVHQAQWFFLPFSFYYIFIITIIVIFGLNLSKRHSNFLQFGSN